MGAVLQSRRSIQASNSWQYSIAVAGQYVQNTSRCPPCNCFQNVNRWTTSLLIYTSTGRTENVSNTLRGNSVVYEAPKWKTWRHWVPYHASNTRKSPTQQKNHCMFRISNIRDRSRTPCGWTLHRKFRRQSFSKSRSARALSCRACANLE